MPSLSFRAGNLLIFSLEVCIAALMFARHCKVRKRFFIYLIPGIAVIVGACFFLPWVKQLILDSIGHSVASFSYGVFSVAYILTFSVNFIIAIILCFVFYSVFDSRLSAAMYIACASFLVRNIAWGSYSVFMIFSNADMSSVLSSFFVASNIFIYLLIYAAVYVAAYFIFIRKFTDAGDNDFPAKIAVYLVAIVTICVAIDSIDAPKNNEPATTVYFCLIISGVCLCIIGLMLQFLMFDWYKNKFEQAMLQKIIEQQRKQYLLAKESMDAVNINAHDLKNQIGIIMKAMHGAEKDSSINNYLGNMAEAVDVFDSMFNTENKALNIVLNEKSIMCRSKGIKLSVIADGKLLAFMPELDIYMLLGNAIDNAIEAAEQVEDIEKRIISFSLRENSGTAWIHIENTYKDAPVFKNGILQTSKSNKRLHGFGLRSMKNILKKYGGQLNAGVRRNIFCLDMLIPLHNEAV